MNLLKHYENVVAHYGEISFITGNWGIGLEGTGGQVGMVSDCLGGLSPHGFKTWTGKTTQVVRCKPFNR